MVQFRPETERGIHVARVALGLCLVPFLPLFAPTSLDVAASAALPMLGGAAVGIVDVWLERTGVRPIQRDLSLGRVVLWGLVAGLVGPIIADRYPIVFWYGILGFFIVSVADSLQWLLARQDWGRVTNFG